MQAMKLRINDLPIRSKFILQFFLGVLLPIAALLIYVLTNVTAEIRQRENQNAMQSMDRVYTTLETQFSQAVSLSNNVSTDAQVKAFLNHRYQTPPEYYNSYYCDLRPIMNRYLYAYVEQATGIEIYTDNPTMFNGGYCPRITAELNTEEWYSRQISISPMLIAYIRQIPGTIARLQLSIVRLMNSNSAYAQLLKLDLNMEPIHRIVEQETEYLSVYLVAPDGTSVSYPGSMTDSMVAKRDTMPPKTVDLTRLFGESTAMSGWKLVANINKGPMEDNIRNAIWVGLLLGAVCSLFAGGLSRLFSRSIALRSQRLLRHMDSITAESFSPIKKEMGKDEIGELMEHFNTMGERLKQLINDIYVLQLHQKSLELENVRAELKYLQAQIDPHFLFNTLNAILVLCVRNGYTELAEIISPLSKIMRRMVDTSRDIIPLKEELEFVRMVLKIEQFRFGEKLQYTFDISDEAMEVPVPVMCVQGLVENACKHGIQHITGQGVVLISARVEGGMLFIDVSDNGAGISPKRLYDLQKFISSPEDMKGSVGLQNIYRRLKLHYGVMVSLTLANAQDRGTIVSIRIPVKGDEQACCG
jgi:two-component system sensor histidine kinase YesM